MSRLAGRGVYAPKCARPEKRFPRGLEPSGQERYIAQTFCSRAATRVQLALDQIEANDDERMVAITKLAPKRGAYGYAFFED